MRPAAAAIGCAFLLLAASASAQDVKGSLTANGKTGELRYAIAQEVESGTENGYMDVIVVLSDRKLPAADARNVERLEAMARKDGLVAFAAPIALDPGARTVPRK
ncbi:MAG: hypothetical protein U1F41_05295 [Burkholderiales bacterium]